MVVRLDRVHCISTCSLNTLLSILYNSQKLWSTPYIQHQFIKYTHALLYNKSKLTVGCGCSATQQVINEKSPSPILFSFLLTRVPSLWKELLPLKYSLFSRRKKILFGDGPCLEVCKLVLKTSCVSCAEVHPGNVFRCTWLKHTTSTLWGSKVQLPFMQNSPAMTFKSH